MKTEENIEKLSALLDEELGYHESLALMGRLEKDSDLNRKIHRYAVAKEFMRAG